MKSSNTQLSLSIQTPSLFSEENIKIKKTKFKFIDLFAGIGGTRLAFEKVGGGCVFSSEWDKFCQKTYRANFGEIPYGDITKIEAEHIPDFDILIAGFPCQPFSTIGKRQGFKHKTQGTLFYDIARIIKQKKPKAFLLENVSGLVNHNQGNTIKVIEDSLNELGYYVFYEILNSAKFGLPQKRKRIYIVGLRKNLFGKKPKFVYPRGNSKPVYINAFVEKNKDGYEISKHLQRNYLFKKNDGRPEIIDRSSKIQVKTLVSTYHKIQRLTGTFVRDGKTGLRLLTENECKAIMGFPKTFVFPVSRTQMYRQLGNSVTIPVVEKVAEKMLKILENKL